MHRRAYRDSGAANFTELNFTTSPPTVAYNTAIDPTIDDNILVGSLTMSVYSVISDSHGSNPDAYDYTGMFASKLNVTIVNP